MKKHVGEKERVVDMNFNYLKTIIRKEFWHYRSNYRLSGGLTIILSIVILMEILAIKTGAESITPQSRALALKQISEDPDVFGLSPRDVNTMDIHVITFATLVAQSSLIISILTFLMTYTSVIYSFAMEKIDRTMEILFASPLSDREIILGKSIACSLYGILVWINILLANLLPVEYLCLKHLHKIWIPTRYYLDITVLLPFSMLLLAIFLGLILSVKLKNIESISLLGTVVALLPVLIFFIGTRFSTGKFFLLYRSLCVIFLILLGLVIILAKKVVNRKAFITT